MFKKGFKQGHNLHLSVIYTTMRNVNANACIKKTLK